MLLDPPPPKGFAGAAVEEPLPPKEKAFPVDELFAAAAAPPPNTGAPVCPPLLLPPNASAGVFEIPPNTDEGAAAAAMEDGAVAWLEDTAAAVEDIPNAFEGGAANPENVFDAVVGVGILLPEGPPPPPPPPPKENIDGTLFVGAEVTPVAPPPPNPKVALGAVEAMDCVETMGSSAGVGSFDGVTPNANDVVLRLVAGSAAVVVVVAVGGFDVPNEKVGTGILLGSGCFAGKLVGAAAGAPPKLKEPTEEGGAAVAAAGGDFGNEKIPEIEGLTGSPAVVVVAVVKGAAATLEMAVVAIGVTPDRVGRVVPNLNPVASGLFTAVGVEVGVVVTVLLNENIAAVGELNPIFSVVAPDVAVAELVVAGRADG